MIPRISAFANLPTPVKIGLLVASGGGLITVLYVLFPPQLLWILFLGLAVVALLVVLYWRLLKRFKQRKAAPMQRELMDNTAATPQGVSKAAHVAKLDDLRKKFEGGVAQFQAAGKSLYSLPWYIIVGEPGSGKTEAIRHCNVGFPPGLQDEFQGAGGTLNMNWWFTDHAVILDTAGRLMFEEVETGGSSEWREFLNLLKKSRPRCPINGVLLVIPADSLIRDTADEIEQKASKIARQFSVIQRALDVRFPVFVVVTKSDLINGFRDFFENLTDPQLQHQILGWSNPGPLDEPYNTDFVDQHLKAIRGRLFRRRLALMQEIVSEEPGVEQQRAADTLYAFPQSLGKIAPRMARYLELIFSVGSQWSGKPLFFRGIYFTSSMREGSVLDADLAESLGMSIDSLPDGRVWERDRAYFLRDLFVKKVFREQGLVTYATDAKKQHSRRKAIVLLSAAASVVLLLLFTFYAASSFGRSIGKLKPYLTDPANWIGSGQYGRLKVIEGQEDDYGYYGKSTLKLPEGTKRSDFAAHLVSTITEWEKTGIHWMFAPAAKFAEFEADKLNRAQAVVYEVGVLQPFLGAASDMMDTQRNGTWTRDEPETKALRQLLQIRASRLLQEEGPYSTKTFLDPLAEYVLKHDPNQVQLYQEDKDDLHRPLAAIYGKTWHPADLLGTDPNATDAAIERGVGLFIDYWKDPNQVGRYSRDYAEVETIVQLKEAVRDFNDAEQLILGLGDEFDLKSKTSAVRDLDNYVKRWNERFEQLRKAKESVDSCAGTAGSAGSLETLWTKVTNTVRQQVSENYDFLLSELQDVNEPEDAFLSRIRSSLQAARNEMLDRLREDRFTEALKELDRDFWMQSGGKRLYGIRFDMYTQANRELSVEKSLSSINEVTGAILQVKKAVTDARANIDVLQELNRNAFRVEQAAKISRDTLNLAERRQLYAIAERGLRAAPSTAAELTTLTAKQAQQPWAGIDGLKALMQKQAKGEISGSPLKDIEKYDPNAAATVLDAWKALGTTLEEALPQEGGLKKRYADANGIYAEYAEQCLNYWFGEVPKYVITNKAQDDSQRIKDLTVTSVLTQLHDQIGNPLEKVRVRLGGHISPSHKTVEQFRANLDKLKSRYDTTYRQCRKLVSKWRELSDEASQARTTLLSMAPADYRDDYAHIPSSYETPAQFVDMYWVELTCTLVRQLADQVQSEGTEALDKLLAEYGNKFPLAREGKQDLSLAEFKESLSWLRKAVPLEEYAPGTLGAGEKTRIDKVDTELRRLREPLAITPQQTRVEGIIQVFRGLPGGETPYYCRITLLGANNQEAALLDQVREFAITQGSDETVRRTRQQADAFVGTVKYPGPPVTIAFYTYRKDSDPAALGRMEFSQPWACLRMLHECSVPDKEQGYVRLYQDKMPAGLWLKLEFCRERDGSGPVSFPRINDWPSVKD